MKLTDGQKESLVRELQALCERHGMIAAGFTYMTETWSLGAITLQQFGFDSDGKVEEQLTDALEGFLRDNKVIQ